MRTVISYRLPTGATALQAAMVMTVCWRTGIHILKPVKSPSARAPKRVTSEGVAIDRGMHLRT